MKAEDTNWHPIHTVPKDGTAVLILDEDTDIPYPCRWDNIKKQLVMTWDDTLFYPMPGAYWMYIPNTPKGHPHHRPSM